MKKPLHIFIVCAVILFAALTIGCAVLFFDGAGDMISRQEPAEDGELSQCAEQTMPSDGVSGDGTGPEPDGTEPPERTIEQAAELAAFYSQNREAGKTAVDYTMIRNVRKPAGALPGKVIYTDYSTVLVQPEISAEKK